MINFLHIENLGIIDEIEIDFDPKLNILTGETGAGKTLIVESLNLLAGSRFSKDMIKRGKDYLLVEASVTLNKEIYIKAINNMNNIIEEFDVEDKVETILYRKVDKQGKNICKINGNLVTVNDLRNFMLYIIDIHGQHENQNIMLNETQIELIDKFADKEISPIYSEYMLKYNERKNILNLLDKDLKDEMYTKRQIDLLKFQIEEIEEANLIIGEDDEIETKFKILNSSEKISKSLLNSKEILSEETLKNLSVIIHEIEHLIIKKYKIIVKYVY